MTSLGYLKRGRLDYVIKRIAYWQTGLCNQEVGQVYHDVMMEPRSHIRGERMNGDRKSYVETQLDELEWALRQESRKRTAPPRKGYTPYIFNKLTPYCDVKTAKFLGHWPDLIKHGYVSRNTATGLCDPWVNLQMDLNPLPKLDSRALVQQGTRRRNPTHSCRQQSQKEGSTRLPAFPVISVPRDDYEFCDLTTKNLYYSDVPMLRKKIAQRYGSDVRERVARDYVRTKQDFYRMELDRLDQYHERNRSRMMLTYGAYLQNTLGSKKALRECIYKAQEHLA